MSNNTNEVNSLRRPLNNAGQTERNRKNINAIIAIIEASGIEILGAYKNDNWNNTAFWNFDINGKPLVNVNGKQINFLEEVIEFNERTLNGVSNIILNGVDLNQLLTTISNELISLENDKADKTELDDYVKEVDFNISQNSQDIITNLNKDESETTDENLQNQITSLNDKIDGFASTSGVYVLNTTHIVSTTSAPIPLNEEKPPDPTLLTYSGTTFKWTSLKAGRITLTFYGNTDNANNKLLTGTLKINNVVIGTTETLFTANKQFFIKTFYIDVEENALIEVSLNVDSGTMELVNSGSNIIYSNTLATSEKPLTFIFGDETGTTFFGTNINIDTSINLWDDYTSLFFLINIGGTGVPEKGISLELDLKKYNDLSLNNDNQNFGTIGPYNEYNSLGVSIMIQRINETTFFLTGHTSLEMNANIYAIYGRKK